MELSVGHYCPSCGAPVEMNETDRLTECSFCDVKNYMVDSGLLRYTLPSRQPDQIEQQQLFYFPYLRFKGNLFSCQGHDIEYKVLDTTYQGVDSKTMPMSLGLRPQTMKVNLVDENCIGRFIGRGETAVTVLQKAAMSVQMFSDSAEAPLYHRAFIGETVSCVYQPVYIKENWVYDAVLNRPMGKAETWFSDPHRAVSFDPQWKPRFLATICPQCGDNMRGERDSLILHCYNCNSCWAEKKGKFVPVPYSLVAGTSPGMVFLPFWQISAIGKGIRLNTMADLLTLTNQPVVVNDHHHDRDLMFFVPAMKLRPKVFVKLAKNATLSQLKYPDGTRNLEERLYPVTLPLKEALQALKSIFAETTVNRKDMLPKLPQLSFSVKSTALVFLPFEDTGHDLVQNHSALSVAATVVQTGRKL